jgi:hypothetical protein
VVLAIDRENVVGEEQAMSAFGCAHGERPGLVRLPNPDLLDTPDIALGRLDDEAVGLDEPLSLCTCSHGVASDEVPTRADRARNGGGRVGSGFSLTPV